MVRVTTASDVELQVLLLTDDGKRKFEDGESITASDVLFNPEDINTNIEIYLKIDKSQDEPFVAKFVSKDNTQENCYAEPITLEDGTKPYILVVTIPSNTFSTHGRLMMSIQTNKADDHFVDGKLTVTQYEKTEVYYVMQ